MQLFCFLQGLVRGLFYRPLETEVTPINKKLKPKERLFCECFVSCGDAARAALRAGYRGAHDGEGLLCQERILREIERLVSLRSRIMAGMAESGYYRLAFGGISDALRLLYLDEPTEEQLEKMDLFLISEIKKPKDGMLEIKFFDRLKALEKLGGSDGGNAGVAGLYEAIGRGAETAGDFRD